MNRAGASNPLSKLMRQLVFSLIRVRRGAAGASHGVLLAGRHAIPVVLGRSGIAAGKREGDGATPRGRFRLIRLWWRADRTPRPHTLLSVRRIDPALAWCENPADRRYNRPFRRSANEPGDRLWRQDGLYDLVIEIDHNVRPRAARRGSAVFIHVARAGFAPTAGCVALRAEHLKTLLSRINLKTRILIQS